MILIALGANLPSAAGNPADTLASALRALGTRNITVERQSGFYRSAAWPNPDDPAFVNGVAAVRTHLTPQALLAQLHDVEAEFGRSRSHANAPRTLDLDLLDYDGLVQIGPPELPHPRIKERAFVLLPLRDVVADWRHPVGGWSVDELIALLPASDIAPLTELGGIDAPSAGC
jgi:2-amino-4-hydroxy-6-hydroxymethyldihydropteridine diphosphokinase